MLNLEKYLSVYGCSVQKMFKNTNDRCICLVRNPYGVTLVWRLYSRPVPAYEKLLETHCEELPWIYRYIQTDEGGCLVEEEFVDGVSLTELLQGRCLDEQQTGEITHRVCRALSVLHKLGMVHRDVKTDNVLMTSEGRVTLIDLDAVSTQNSEKNRDTRLLGTVGYAAPEQYGFGRSDGRADIFSVGVMMNVLLCGQHPANRLADGPLRAVIEKCIAVNVDQRYHVVEQLMEHLPKSKMTQCPKCGFVSPGDSCMLCGASPEVAARQRKRIPWVVAACCFLAVMLGSFLMAKALLAGEDLPPQPSISVSPQAESTPTPTPTPELTPTPEPTPTPTPKPKDFPQYGEGKYGHTIEPTVAQFRCDMNGDGVLDSGYYYYVIAAETPFGLEYMGEESFELDPASGETVTRRVAAVVCTKSWDGRYIPVPGAGSALQYCRLYFYQGYLCGEMPVVQELDALDGWDTAAEVEFTPDTTGKWVIEARCYVNGQNLATTAVVNVEQPLPKDELIVSWGAMVDGGAYSGARETELEYVVLDGTVPCDYQVYSCRVLLMDNLCMRFWFEYEAPKGLEMKIPNLLNNTGTGMYRTKGVRELLIHDASQGQVNEQYEINVVFYSGNQEYFTICIPTHGLVDRLKEEAMNNRRD